MIVPLLISLTIFGLLGLLIGKLWKMETGTSFFLACIFVIGGVVLWFAVRALAHISVESVWYESLGFGQLWSDQFWQKLLLSVIGFAASYIFLRQNFKYAWKSVPKPTPNLYRRQTDDNSFTTADFTRWLLTIARGAVSIGFALSLSGMWSAFVGYVNGGQFPGTDPVLGMNIGYYVFELPMWNSIVGWLAWLVILSLGQGLVIYLFADNQADQSDQDTIWVKAVGHASFLFALLFAIMAAGSILAPYNLMVNGNSSRLTGAGWTDINIRIPNFRMVAVIEILMSIVLIVNTKVRQIWLGVVAVATPFVITLVFLTISPAIMQGVQVNPNELTSEAQYMQYSIDATRSAYGLDQVQVKPYTYTQSLEPGDYQNNDSSLAKVRVMDYTAVDQANDSLQEIKQFYNFPDNDVVRLQDSQMYFAAPRELEITQLPSQARTWSNEHLQYTHGYGLTISRVDKADAQGLPSYVAKDIPVNGPDWAQVQHPEIYFGESTWNWAVISTTMAEFSRPTGSGSDEYVYYAGNAGITLNPLRFAFATELDDFQILLSNFFTPNSKVLWRRSLDQRVPNGVGNLFKWDLDPYVAIGTDRIYYIWDGYTVTDMYPYSEHSSTSNLGGFNYIRNSIKAAIDTYEGTVTLYVVDPNDPIVKMWEAAFPGMLRPTSEMPSWMKRQLRYPEDLFNVVAAKYATFHMTTPAQLYNREDQWQLPTERYYEQTVSVQMRFAKLQLPGSTTDEFIGLEPFAANGKQNLVAWFTAQMDAPNYGKLTVWTFPRNENVLGPQQAENILSTDTQLSGEVTLWGQRGSKVLWGNLMTLPVRGSDNVGSVIYVKPLYLLAEGDKAIPRLTRVVIVTGDAGVIEANTLTDALALLYSGQVRHNGSPALAQPNQPPPSGTPVPVQLTGDMARLAQQAQQYYDAAQACLNQQPADWKCYGDNEQLLGQVISQMNASWPVATPVATP